jgi:hypothetical protein
VSALVLPRTETPEVLVATPAERALLREMISEPDDANGWTDDRLDAVILATLNTDGSANLRRAAGNIWEAKAATMTSLTDVTESGSSRRLSQAFDHAMKMAGLYGGSSTDPTLVAMASRPQSQKIVRATRD